MFGRDPKKKGGEKTLRVFSHSSKYNSNYPSGSLRDPSGNSQLYSEFHSLQTLRV
jgi:hypothetical protein